MCLFQVYVCLCFLERNILYPVLFLGALTSDSPKVIEKLGPLSGSLVVVVCGLKCLRGSFSDPSTQYLVLVFAVLFFHMDYSSASETFIVDYFFMGIIFSKTYEFLLKVCERLCVGELLVVLRVVLPMGPKEQVYSCVLFPWRKKYNKFKKCNYFNELGQWVILPFKINK